MLGKFIGIPKYVINLFLGNKIDFSSRVSFSSQIRKSRIGKFSFVGRNTSINHANIGNYVSIAPSTMIGGMEHELSKASTSNKIYPGKKNLLTQIQDNVWIGANVVIKQGVTIARGSIIAAGSVLLEDTERYCLYAGSPAKLKKIRFTKDEINKIEETKFWEQPPQDAKNILSNLNLG